MARPRGEPIHLEERLLIWAEILEKAVDQVQQTIAEIRASNTTHTSEPPRKDGDPTHDDDQEQP